MVLDAAFSLTFRRFSLSSLTSKKQERKLEDISNTFSVVFNDLQLFSGGFTSNIAKPPLCAMFQRTVKFTENLPLIKNSETDVFKILSQILANRRCFSNPCMGPRISHKHYNAFAGDFWCGGFNFAVLALLIEFLLKKIRHGFGRMPRI
jgi:hypothetical protein